MLINSNGGMFMKKACSMCSISYFLLFLSLVFVLFWGVFNAFRGEKGYVLAAICDVVDVV